MTFLECDSLDRGAHRSGGSVYSPLPVYYRVHYQPRPPPGDLGRDVLACVLAPRLPPGATQPHITRTRDAPDALCLLGSKIFFLFGCGSFLNSLLNLLQYYFCFMFWLFRHEVCGILTPQPGLKPTAPVLGGKVLTAGPSEKFLTSYSYHNTIIGSILA